ncbi:MAG: four helix bundle protein [Vicinamibacterales bacterium]
MRREMGVSRFEDLVAWQEAREYCAEMGRVTDTPEFFRDGVLRPRMNKAALSIMENIAEGFERESLPEFSQFLKIAKGSTGEARAQLYAAKDRSLLRTEEFDRLFAMNVAIGKMLRRLRESLPLPRSTHQGRRTRDLPRTRD